MAAQHLARKSSAAKQWTKEEFAQTKEEGIAQ